MDMRGTLIIKQLKAYISRDLSHLGKLSPQCTIKIGGEKQTTQPTKKPGQNPEWQVSHKFLVQNQSTCELEITNSQEIMGQSTQICAGSFQIRSIMDRQDIKCDLYYKNNQCGSILVIADWVEFGRVAVSFTKMGLKAMAETIFDLEAQQTGGQLNSNRVGPALAQVFAKLGESAPPNDFIPIALKRRKLENTGRLSKKDFCKFAKEICGFSKSSQITTSHVVSTTTTSSSYGGSILTLKIIEGKFLHDKDVIGKMDPYIVLEYGNQKKKTSIKNNAGKTPKWNEDFVFEVNANHDHVYFTAYDEDPGKDDVIGEGDITLSTYNGKGKTLLQVPFKYKGKNQGTVTMELHYVVGGSVSYSSVQYKPVEYESKVYQSYAVHSEVKPDFTFKAERKEIEKQAKPVIYESSYKTSYVTDIKEIKQPVEFRGELQILLSESSTVTVHTQTIEQFRHQIEQLKQEKQHILNEKYQIESELHKVKDMLLEREILYKANYEKLRLAFESLQYEISIKIKAASEKYRVKFKKYKNDWKVINYSKGQREQELLAIIESLNVKIRGLESDLTERSSAYSQHITLISSLKQQISEMELKYKSQYDSIIMEWQMKFNSGTEKYKQKFKKYKSYYKSILVQKGEWEKERNLAIESYVIKIRDLEGQLQHYISIHSKYESEINEYKYKLSNYDSQWKLELSKKDEEMRIHIENLRIERERYQILLKERDSNLSIVIQMKKDIERWQIEIFELKKVIEAKQEEIDRLEADQAMRDDELIRLKKEFAKIFEMKDIEIKQKKFEILQYIEDIALLEQQKIQFIDLISDVYFKKYDRTKKQTLDKGEYDRAVCELFEQLGEASPPYELSLKFMQKHDSGNGNLQFSGFKLSMRDLFNFILEQKRDLSRQYLKWDFVGKISKKELKNIGKQIFAKADRNKSDSLDEKEFDYAICLMFEQLNTRAPDVKLTRRILEKYGYQNRKIKEKEFVKVVKDLCGFSTKQLEIVTAEEVFTKQRKITEMKKKEYVIKR